MHPRWAFNYFAHEKFELPQLQTHVQEGSNIAISVSDYFSIMLDQSMNWDDASAVRNNWGGEFCLKGVMSVADARRAVDIGATAIMVSNHGGRQLDGSRSPFDQISEIVDAVGKACSGGRMYLYALAAAGQPGVEKALDNMRAEIERDMKLMGVTKVSDLSRDNLRYR
jgi:L-lactate dehydrogenase (cytochrome)